MAMDGILFCAYRLIFMVTSPGIFFAILGRGPRAFQIGKISAVSH